MSKSRIIREAASNIERGRTYCWYENNCCQIAHLVQVIQDITRTQIRVPFHTWHVAYRDPSMGSNPHLIALRKNGFSLIDVVSLEMLVSSYRFGIIESKLSEPPIYEQKDAVIRYMYGYADELERIATTEGQRDFLNRCLSVNTNPCIEIQLPPGSY